MRFLFGKTAFLALLLMICSLLSSVAMAADIYDGSKSDIQAGRTEIALGALQEIIKQQPDAYQAWFLIGVAHAGEQQFHQAIEAFRHVIELNPLLAEPHNNLAVIYNELGDVRAAVNELEQSLKKRPDYAIVEENIADLYVKLALQNYRNALEKEPREGLEKRYMRLLQVRDPTALSGLSETTVTLPSPVPKQEVVNREVEHVADQSAAIKPEQIEALPKELPVMDLKVGLSSTEADESVQIKNIEKEILEAVEMWRVAWS
ncbi:MAG: tetratricopeptide repeat protein, partial [Mariprofundaceae bacterium]